MNYNALINFAAALLCGSLACTVTIRDPRSFVHRIFAFGLLLLGLESLFTALSILAREPGSVIVWQRWRWAAASLLPGTLLIFCLSFGRLNYLEILSKWKFAVITAFMFHIILISDITHGFFKDLPVPSPSGGWIVPLGWSGYVFQIIFLLSIVLIMILIERILRSSGGITRWQVKFLTLGIVCYLATRIYTTSQTLLFRRINLNLEIFSGTALLVAGFMIVLSFQRTRVLPKEIYLSRKVLHNSLTLLLLIHA